MMPANLRVLNIDAIILSPSGLTIEEWVNQYVESGLAARDYDRLLDVQRKAWLSELQALDAGQLRLDETA
jgi:hypothetical protein